MDILEYYKEQQKYKDWYDKFQSTATNKSGKVFSYTSTTYRYMNNFLKDLEKFEINNGVPKSEWNTYADGQLVDKQRTLPLSLLGLIKNEGDQYTFTALGWTCFDLINAELASSQKWFLLYLIMLNYRSRWRENDIILTAREHINYLLRCNIPENEILDGLREIQKSKNIEEIMKTDIFWYITFAKDTKFIEKYYMSTEIDKNMLYSYVINEQQKSNSKDCIGHKYKPGGQMLPGTFLEECKILYVSYKLSKKRYEEFSLMLGSLIEIYKEISTLNEEEKVKKFIESHKSVYNDIFMRSILRSKKDE